MAKKAKRATDAITLLKDDHKKVRALLASLEKTTERSAERRTKLLQQIEAEINVHASIEEEIFYPAYREAVKKKDDIELYQEALEEHHVVDLVLPELKASDPGGRDLRGQGHRAQGADRAPRRRGREGDVQEGARRHGQGGAAGPRVADAGAQEAAQGGGIAAGRAGPRGPDRGPVAGRLRGRAAGASARRPRPRCGSCGGGSGAAPAPLPCCRTPRPSLPRA